MRTSRIQMLVGLGVPQRFAGRIADRDGERGRFEFRNADEKHGEILIYDFIGYDWWTDGGMTAKRFDEELKALGDIETLTVRINSPGGDVWDGMSIYNQLISFDAKVNVIVDGMAASAASFIAMAGETVEAYELSQLMIHDAWTIVAGNAQDFAEWAQVLDKVDGQIASAYASKSGREAAEFRELMDTDTYLTAAEAMELGLVDGIITKKETTKDTGRSLRNRNRNRLHLLKNQT